MVNLSFYGNKSENFENSFDIDEEKDVKIKEENIKKDSLLNKEKKHDILNKEKKDEKVLIFKTPNKEDKSNQENMDGNIIKNLDINGIQKNLNFLFEQRNYI